MEAAAKASSNLTVPASSGTRTLNHTHLLESPCKLWVSGPSALESGLLLGSGNPDFENLTGSSLELSQWPGPAGPIVFIGSLHSLFYFLLSALATLELLSCFFNLSALFHSVVGTASVSRNSSSVEITFGSKGAVSPGALYSHVQ